MPDRTQSPKIIIAGAFEYGGKTVEPLYDLDITDLSWFFDNLSDEERELRMQSYVMNDLVHPNPIGYRAIAEDLAALIP